MGVKQQQIYSHFIVVLVLLLVGFLSSAAEAHQCSHGHHHHDEHDEDLALVKSTERLLPEELAEEEDLKTMWAHDHDHDHVHGHHGHDHVHGHHGHDHDGDTDLSGLGLWIHAMACSLLVSLASLICLILLPVIFIQGKPSKAVVDSLALFGAGAMLGDAFLHQLPHAFGGEQSHSHDHHGDHDHHAHSGQSHSHSLKDLSIGLSILAGIVAFLIVEKLVRYVEAFSGGESAWGIGHHHHHHKHPNKLKDDDNHERENPQESSHYEKNEKISKKTRKEKNSDGPTNTAASNDKISEKDSLHKRNTGSRVTEDETDSSAKIISNGNVEPILVEKPVKSQSSLVFGYLNLFSDGVHNFTDGMALGSAFLLYGSVGGWSRTVFLLAHELPQEIGDFGILVRSGFSVSKALFFNFLSALVALAGTALALMWGKDPGQSSLIEGFTAGGFIYIALGVLAEMNNGAPTMRNTAAQLVSLMLGMGVALCISLVE